MVSLVENLQRFRDFSKKTFGTYPEYVTLKHTYEEGYTMQEIADFRQHLESDGKNHIIFGMKIKYVLGK